MMNREGGHSQGEGEVGQWGQGNLRQGINREPGLETEHLQR